MLRVLISEDELLFYGTIDWQQESDRFRQANLIYPHWLIRIFKEPYAKAYAAGSVDDWMRLARFEAVQTECVGWVQQVTCGIKPIVPVDSPK